MKKYQYVPVESKWNLGGRILEDHRPIIDQYAAKGYRYVGYIPTKYRNYLPIAWDLIFEMEV